MSTVPKRKPLPPPIGQSPEAIADPFVPAQLTSFATSVTDSEPKKDDRTERSAGSPTSNMKRDELIVERATLEQLTYLLLDLINGLPQDRPALPPSTNTRAQAAHLLTTSSLSSNETVKLSQTYTSQEVLKLDINQIDGVSKELLQRKPWLNERVITVQTMEIMNRPSSTEVQEEGIFPVAGIESIPLRIGRQRQDVYQFQENSLYTLEGNHPWTDLHTHLGPAQYTDEGRKYWENVRGTRGWPLVLQPDRIEKYVTELWHVMTMPSPDPDPTSSILSDFARDNAVFKAYKYVIARGFLQRLSPKTPAHPGKRKRGHTSKTMSRWRALYRNLFNTNDTARARLPSTSYLRIVGQAIFRNSLPPEVAYDADTSIAVLTACLRLIAERSVSNREDTEMSESIQITTTRPAIAALFNGSITIWDLLAYCYQSKILEQPPRLPSEEALRAHTLLLLSSLQLINTFSSGLDKQMLHSIATDELLSSSVGSICSRSNIRRREPTYVGTIEYFGKKELNIQTLQDVGALNILWTRIIDDHLILDTQFAELRLFWPAWALANLPCLRLFAPGPNSRVFDHLLATYKFLFYFPAGIDHAIGEYNKLDPPTWLGSMNVSLSQLTTGRGLIGDPKYHLNAYYENAAHSQFTGENTNLMRFDHCGIFENRVRILKAYMDMQKPSGLRALWRDKRDSGQWYTFWLVSIVGGISILLALASLAVSIAQTAAAFQALQIQTGSNSSVPKSTHHNSTANNTT